MNAVIFLLVSSLMLAGSVETSNSPDTKPIKTERSRESESLKTRYDQVTLNMSVQSLRECLGAPNNIVGDHWSYSARRPPRIGEHLPVYVITVQNGRVTKKEMFPGLDATGSAPRAHAAQPQIEEPKYVLMISFKQPVAAKALAFSRATGQKLLHSPSKDYFYTLVSATKLKDRFGLQLDHSTAKGAGNSIGADAYFCKIRDIKKLKKNIRALVKDLYVEDDPKFEIVDDAEEYQPKK